MARYEVLAEESYRELLSLLKRFSYFSLIPALIGGWAVFVYNSYFGSVDIDLIGPSMGGSFLDVVERYERSHDYEEVKSLGFGVETAHRKPITRQSKFFGYLEIDVCTFESDVGSFHEDSEKKLPYALCSNAGLLKDATFNEKIVVHVPRKALLFLYKLKALRDRAFDLKTRGAVMSAERREWMQGKVEKDGADLIALLNPTPERYVVKEELDYNLLKELIESQNLQFGLKSVNELPDMKKSLEIHSNVSQKSVEQWVGVLFGNLK